MKEIRAVLQRSAARRLSNAGSSSKCNSEMQMLQNRRSNGLISISETKFRLTTFYRISRQKSRAFARRICSFLNLNRAECTAELEVYCIILIKTGKYLPKMGRKRILTICRAARKSVLDCKFVLTELKWYFILGTNGKCWKRVSIIETERRPRRTDADRRRFSRSFRKKER